LHDATIILGARSPNVRFCIAGSMGRRVTPRSEVQGPSTVGVIRNLPSAVRRVVPGADVELDWEVPPEPEGPQTRPEVEQQVELLDVDI